MVAVLNAMERKESSKKARKKGFVTCNVYGPGVERNMDLQIDNREVNKFLKGHSVGAKTKLKVNGNELLCIVKEIQYGPVNRNPLHIDFYTSSQDEVVRIRVPLLYKEREQLARENLVLNILEDEIEIQGTLGVLPEFIEINVSKMKEKSTITVGDINLPEGVRVLSDRDEVVARIVRAGAESDETESGEETEPGEEE